ALDADRVEGDVLGPLVRAVHGAEIGAIRLLEQVKDQADLDAADLERTLEDLFLPRWRRRLEEEAGDLAVLVEHHTRVQFLFLEVAGHNDDVILAALLDPAAQLFLEGAGVADDFLPGAFELVRRRGLEHGLVEIARGLDEVALVEQSDERFGGLLD